MVAMPIYGKKLLKIFFSRTKLALGPNLSTDYGGQKIYQNCYNDGPMETFDLFMAGSNLLPNAFVWALYIHIGGTEVTCRSTVAKIVLMGNLRWPHLVYVYYISMPLCCLLV